MKHQGFIDIFKEKAEWDGNCWVIWLSGEFYNLLLGDYTDILGAFLSRDIHTGSYYLSFLVSTWDDKNQVFLTFSDFPYSVKKKIINYIKSY